MRNPHRSGGRATLRINVTPRVLFTIGYRPKAKPYLHALESCGVETHCMTAQEPVDSLKEYAGLVLGGGTDVDPALYGESPHSETSQPDRARDAMELRLIAEALRRDVPVLAICRGLQMLNVQQGGTLHQHIENHLGIEHDVEVEPESLIARCAGETHYEVLSRHHQAVKDLAPLLCVTARAGDGTVEAVEMEGPRFLAAVQWHPEDRFDKGGPDRRLFEAFARSLRP